MFEVSCESDDDVISSLKEELFREGHVSEQHNENAIINRDEEQVGTPATLSNIVSKLHMNRRESVQHGLSILNRAQHELNERPSSLIAALISVKEEVDEEDRGVQPCEHLTAIEESKRVTDEEVSNLGIGCFQMNSEDGNE
jgi:hypothetical protein